MEVAHLRLLIKQLPSAALRRIALAESIEAKQKEIAKIKSRLNREKQFNKRVAINAELREARQSLERLQQQQAATGSH